MLEPWSDQRLSPLFAIGCGQVQERPEPEPGRARAPTNANLAHAGIGLRYYLSDRFVLHADYTLYTAFVADTRSLEYRACTPIGLSFFF